MPLQTRLCQEAKQSSRRLAVQGIWITDDVLSEAVRRFRRCSHGAQRYGSNVPGPLEARRRLAKRRMMALAGVDTPPPVDPTTLFGMGGPKMGQAVWQAPKAPKDQPKGQRSRSSSTESLSDLRSCPRCQLAQKSFWHRTETATIGVTSPIRSSQRSTFSTSHTETPRCTD